MSHVQAMEKALVAIFLWMVCGAVVAGAGASVPVRLGLVFPPEGNWSAVSVVVDAKYVFHAPAQGLCGAATAENPSSITGSGRELGHEGKCEVVVEPPTPLAGTPSVAAYVEDAAQRGVWHRIDAVEVAAVGNSRDASVSREPPSAVYRTPSGVAVLPRAAQATKPRTGILYEGWHAPPATAMRNISAQGATPLTVEAVIASNGALDLTDIIHKFGLDALAEGFIYQAQPANGFYCIYRRRPGEPGLLPDCPGITETLTRHASQLLAAGVDYVTADGTNLQTMSPQADIIQLRPMEVLFEEWAALRAKGVSTPQIAAWQRSEKGATLWQNVLDLYNNASYADLVLTVGGKQVFFIPKTPDNADPDPGVLAQIQSNGGRNNILVVYMWANLSEEQHKQGIFGFFSECRTPSGVATTSLLGLPGAQCNQIVTTNSPLGTALSASPAFQLNYGSVFGGSPSKLGGRMFKSQFAKIISSTPDNICEFRSGRAVFSTVVFHHCASGVQTFPLSTSSPRSRKLTRTTAISMRIPSVYLQRTPFERSCGWTRMERMSAATSNLR